MKNIDYFPAELLLDAALEAAREKDENARLKKLDNIIALARKLAASEFDTQTDDT